MQRVRVHGTPANRAIGRQPRLSLLVLALAAAAGAALAQQAQPPAAAGKHGGTHTTYCVINLGPGLLSTIPDINAKGQVSFSMGAIGYFYNGAAVQNIGTLGGDTFAVDLNDLGQITGSAFDGSGAERAFVWSEGSGMLDIGTLPGAGAAEAAAINNHGVVTGVSYEPFSVMAFRWSAGSGMEGLGAFTSGLGSASYGFALNDAGLIAGMSSTADNNRHAFAWTRGAGMVDIDTLNSFDALPVAVGAKGEVAGNRIASPANIAYHPFLWKPATGMVDLGTAGGTQAAVISMTPDLHMAGVINLGDDIQRAMSWTPAGGMRRLGTFGGASSRAYDVNAKGQVVGYANNKAGDWRAFLWTAKEGMLDLNDYLRHAPPGLVVEDAIGINDSGAIVATSNAGLVLLKPDKRCTCGHTLGPVVAPALVKAGTPLQASVAFVDEDGVGTRSVSWSWGDGSAAQAGTVSERGGLGKVSASHSFAAPGIYQVAVTVLDRMGRSKVVSHEVVVTAASGGMVAGSGAVMSPIGALGRAPSYAGKAHFSLIAPVAAGARADSSAARLHFDVPGLNFRSQEVRLLGRQGAQFVFEGKGTARGTGGYQFRLSTSASMPGGERGRFALRIWHTDAGSKAEVVDYDNAHTAAGTETARLANGSIVLE